MNSKSRTYNSAINIVVSVGCQIINLIFGFLVRTYFIKLLGTNYLGINGLFSNILSLLSLADLGIGAAISFALFKPIAENNIDKIKALLNFFKKVYIYIALITFFLGCCCIPFLKYLVNLDQYIPNIVLIYILQLLNTVISYFCMYKSTLLIADQRIYITKIISTIGIVFTNIFQLLVLLFWKNYIFYLVVQLISTLLTNLIISQLANKYYPFLKNNKMQLSDNDKIEIFSGIRAMVIYRFSGVILNATDNILISILISTSVVGYYSNYLLITSCVSGIATLIFDALKGSIGSLTADKNIENVINNFDAICLFNFWIYGVISVCLLLLLNDFINVWIGEKYLLDNNVVIALILTIYIPGIMLVIANFRDTTGIFKKTKYVQLVAAILNLLLSLFLGKIFGLFGIIFATTIARVCTSVIYEPYIIFKIYLKKNPIDFYWDQFKNLGIIFLTALFINFITKDMIINTYLLFFIKALICFIVTNLIFLIIYFKKKEFRFLLKKIQFFIIDR